MTRGTSKEDVKEFYTIWKNACCNLKLAHVYKNIIPKPRYDGACNNECKEKEKLQEEERA